VLFWFFFFEEGLLFKQHLKSSFILNFFILLLRSHIFIHWLRITTRSHGMISASKSKRSAWAGFPPRFSQPPLDLHPQLHCVKTWARSSRTYRVVSPRVWVRVSWPRTLAAPAAPQPVPAAGAVQQGPRQRPGGSSARPRAGAAPKANGTPLGWAKVAYCSFSPPANGRELRQPSKARSCARELVYGELLCPTSINTHA